MTGGAPLGVAQAVVLVSHGTVDDLDELPTFLTNIRRGRPPEPELVAELARRYQAIGGRSPLNGINLLLARKLAARLGLPVRAANRLSRPYVREVLESLHQEGARRVVLLPLAQHSAHVYGRDARASAKDLGVDLSCASNWGHSPLLRDAFVRRVAAAWRSVRDPARCSVLMTAHSLPLAVVRQGDPYESELRSAADALGEALRNTLGAELRHTLAFQSQGLATRGPDGALVEWLGPDLPTSLQALSARGDREVVFAPFGFLADHVEILYDLDIEARALCAAHGLDYHRARSLNADDDFVEALAEVARPLLEEG